MPEEQKTGFPMAFFVGLTIVAVALGALYFAGKAPSGRARAPQPLPWGAAEQAYATRVHFLDLRMSRAANLLNQEVTYVFAVLSNDGDRTIRELQVTVEFRDVLNQVVLRDVRRLLGPRAQPIDPLRRREIELTFEHIPEEWNRQYPAIKVTGLALD